MRIHNVLNSAMPGVSRGLNRRRRWLGGSSAGGHVGGEDVVGVAVEVLAGPVVAHRGPRIGVAGRDLDVPQVHSSIEHCRDEGMPEHMRMRSGDWHASVGCEPPQAPGGGVTVHSGTAAVEQDGPAVAVAGGTVDGPPDRWWPWD